MTTTTNTTEFESEFIRAIKLASPACVAFYPASLLDEVCDAARSLADIYGRELIKLCWVDVDMNHLPALFDAGPMFGGVTPEFEGAVAA